MRHWVRDVGVPQRRLTEFVVLSCLIELVICRWRIEFVVFGRLVEFVRFGWVIEFVISRWFIEFVVFCWFIGFEICRWLIEFVAFKWLAKFMGFQWRIEFVIFRCLIMVVRCTYCELTWCSDASFSSWRLDEFVICRWRECVCVCAMTVFFPYTSRTQLAVYISPTQ